MKKIISFILIITSFSLTSFALETNAKYAILIDGDTNDVLFEKNSLERMAPSSMSKMMTAYIIFDYLHKGKLKLTDKVINSENAWKMQGSRMFIPLHSQITIEELLKGLIIQSGNDAAVTLAEAAAGTEGDFASLMNEYSKKMGLKDTNFTNATGWPDPNHYTTAYDLSVIAYRTIKDFPEYYKYYSQIDFEYNKIKQQNRNTLLYNYEGADGLKTGHADAAGYGVTFSAVKNGRRLIGVVNGLPTIKQRAVESSQYLNYGFMNFTNIAIAKKDEAFKDIDVSYGKQKTVAAVSDIDVVMTVANIDKDNIKVKIDYNSPLIAPVAKGQEIGKITVTDIKGNTEKTYPLVASTEVEKANFIQRIFQNLSFYLSK